MIQELGNYQVSIRRWEPIVTSLNFAKRLLKILLNLLRRAKISIEAKTAPEEEVPDEISGKVQIDDDEFDMMIEESTGLIKWETF